MQQQPVLPGYDLSSEMDPKSPTTIIVPSLSRVSLLIRQPLIHKLAVPPPPPGGDIEHK
ncbi:hypothetical protein AVEN_154238-1, partial [Araneus ventricosus]